MNRRQLFAMLAGAALAPVELLKPKPAVFVGIDLCGRHGIAYAYAAHRMPVNLYWYEKFLPARIWPGEAVLPEEFAASIRGLHVHHWNIRAIDAYEMPDMLGRHSSRTDMEDAARAFSASYSSKSKIPYVGWIRSPKEASAAYRAVSES